MNQTAKQILEQISHGAEVFGIEPWNMPVLAKAIGSDFSRAFFEAVRESDPIVSFFQTTDELVRERVNRHADSVLSPLLEVSEKVNGYATAMLLGWLMGQHAATHAAPSTGFDTCYRSGPGETGGPEEEPEPGIQGGATAIPEGTKAFTRTDSDC